MSAYLHQLAFEGRARFENYQFGVARGAVIPVPSGQWAIITGFRYQPAQGMAIGAVAFDNVVQRVSFKSKAGRDYWLVKPQINNQSTAANRGTRNDLFFENLFCVHEGKIGVSIDVGAYSEPVAAANPLSVYDGEALNVLGSPSGSGGVTHYSGLVVRGQGGVFQQPLTQEIAARLVVPPGVISSEQVDFVPEVGVIHWGDAGGTTSADAPITWGAAPLLSVQIWFITDESIKRPSR